MIKVGEEVETDIVLGERISVLFKTKGIEPFCDIIHDNIRQF